MKNNQLKQTKLKLKNHKHKDEMHDPKQPPHISHPEDHFWSRMSGAYHGFHGFGHPMH